MIELVRLVQTCTACPSQWDAWDKDGNYIYIRYRYGNLTVEKFASKDEFKMANFGNYIFDIEHGEFLDGFITEEEMLLLVSSSIHFDNFCL